jgi:ATP-dependent RNA helicase RhlE
MARVIVFTRTKHGADRVARQLDQAGIDAQAIHGDKSQGQRQRALASFHAGKLRVLVATDIASRGIDVDDVTHVVNYELPHEPESYVHRIGRTARAGASGVAISLCDPGERGSLRAIERLTRRKLTVIGEELPMAANDQPANDRDQGPRPFKDRGDGQRPGNGAPKGPKNRRRFRFDRSRAA